MIDFLMEIEDELSIAVTEIPAKKTVLSLELAIVKVLGRIRTMRFNINEGMK